MSESASKTAKPKATKAKTAKAGTTTKAAAKKTRSAAATKATATKAKPAGAATKTGRRLGGAETAVDLPVGVALAAADRVTELVTPWTDRAGAEKKVRAYRGQLEKSLQRAERRGATARSDATDRIRGLQNGERLKVLTDRAEKLQMELTRVLESQSARAQNLLGQVSDQVSALR